MRSLFIACAIAALALPAIAAQPLCIPVEGLKAFTDKLEAKAVFIGVGKDGTRYAIVASEKSGVWAAMRMNDKVACHLVSGESFALGSK